MSTHKKDLTRPAALGRDMGESVVLVTKDGNLPFFRTMFLNGVEVTMPVDAPVRVDYSGNDFVEVNLTVIAGRIETITDSEMLQRLAE